MDMFLPFRNPIVMHDGSSHDNEMPIDRKNPIPKCERDVLWDEDEAFVEGFKVLRLHWRDEDVWGEYLIRAYEECDTGNIDPLYTPSV